MDEFLYRPARKAGLISACRLRWVWSFYTDPHVRRVQIAVILVFLIKFLYRPARKAGLDLAHEGRPHRWFLYRPARKAGQGPPGPCEPVALGTFTWSPVSIQTRT